MNRQQIYNIIENSDYRTVNWSRVYEYIMYIAIIFGIFPLMFRRNREIYQWMDQISCACFIIDYVIRWLTYDIDRKVNGKKHGFWCFILYPFTPMAIIDLLSILPTFTTLNYSFKLMRGFRLLKLLRIIKAAKVFRPLILLTNVIKKQRMVLLTVLNLAALYIIVTALIMFNTDEGVENVHNFTTFFDALYWATCTLTTVGYGDIYPVTDIGRVISMISSLVGVAIIALPSGVITAGYLEELREEKEKQSTDSDVDKSE